MLVEMQIIILNIATDYKCPSFYIAVEVAILILIYNVNILIAHILTTYKIIVYFS